MELTYFYSCFMCPCYLHATCNSSRIPDQIFFELFSIIVMCQLGVNVAPAAGTLGTYYPCSGNGKCVSLGEIISYNSTETSYTDWDSDRIRGCVCDPGFQGVACADRSCPKGDDPLTNGTDAVQLIDCKCSSCVGTIRVLFNGKLSNPIPYDSSAALIKLRLEVKYIR